MSYDKKCDKGIFVEILQLRSALVEQIFQRNTQVFLEPGGVKFLPCGDRAFLFEKEHCFVFRAPESVCWIMGRENDLTFQMFLIQPDQVKQWSLCHIPDFFKFFKLLGIVFKIRKICILIPKIAGHNLEVLSVCGKSFLPDFQQF